jgi:hypothetical protein
MLSIVFENDVNDPELALAHRCRVDVPVARMRVQALIEASVRAQLAMQKLLHPPKVQGAYLDHRDIESALASGKVVLEKQSDDDEEVARCVHAFKAGKFQIVIDGQWFRQFNDEVELHQDSKIVFLRLLPLVGG